MRWFGNVLFGLGLTLGAALGLGVLLGIGLPGLPWLVTVGLVKLTFVGALGLIVVGAVLHRLAARDDRLELLPSPAHPDDIPSKRGMSPGHVHPAPLPSPEPRAYALNEQTKSAEHASPEHEQEARDRGEGGRHGHE